MLLVYLSFPWVLCRVVHKMCLNLPLAIWPGLSAGWAHSVGVWHSWASSWPNLPGCTALRVPTSPFSAMAASCQLHLPATYFHWCFCTHPNTYPGSYPHIYTHARASFKQHHYHRVFFQSIFCLLTVYFGAEESRKCTFWCPQNEHLMHNSLHKFSL